MILCSNGVPELPAGSARAAVGSPAAAEDLTDGPAAAAAAAAASVSSAGAGAGAAGALTETGVSGAAELVVDPGDTFLGVAAAKRSESSSLSGSA